MNQEFTVAISNPKYAGALLYSMWSGDTTAFLSCDIPVDTSVTGAVLIRIRVSDKSFAHGFATYPGSIHVTIPDDVTPQMLRYYSAALHALYCASSNGINPWIFPLDRNGVPMYLVINKGGWAHEDHATCVENDRRPRCPERNMVSKLGENNPALPFPLKELPRVTALSGPPNTNKTKLAVWLAKHIGKGKHILLIDPTQGATHFPGVSVWSDGGITKKKLMTMLSLYAKDGRDWIVIILDNAIKTREICGSLKQMTKSLPIKFILISHENSWNRTTAKVDYTLTDVWIRTMTARDNAVAFTISTENAGSCDPITQSLL